MRDAFWQLFCRTGLPQAYLLYKNRPTSDGKEGPR